MSNIKLEDLKSIAKMALPLMAAFLAQKGMQLIDTVMMGWIGPEALAAGALATTVFLNILVFCRGTLSAVGVYISQARGANNYQDIGSTLWHGIYLALLFSPLCMLLAWYAPDFIVTAKNYPDVFLNTKLLLHGLLLGFPGILLFWVFREFVASFSLTRIDMIVSLCSIPLAFAGNYILIYGKLGFPALGVAGIGYASAAVMWVMFFGLLIYSLQHAELKKHLGLNSCKFHLRKLLDLLYLGVPSGITVLMDVGMILTAAIMIGHFGVIALAAFQIAIQCASLAFNFPLSLSVVAGLKIGHAVGMGDNSLARRYTYLIMLIGLLLALFIALIFLFAPEILVMPFLKKDAENYSAINQLAASFIMVAAFFKV